MNEAYTTNPLTGNLIKVGGSVYKKLMRGKATKGMMLNFKSKAKKRSVKRSLKRSVKRSLKRSVKRSLKRSVGRGGRTRGWKVASPARGRERSAMKKKCGSKCFLSPARNGYPICARNTCKPDCRGIISAKVRAGQYKETTVMALARRMERKFCL